MATATRPHAPSPTIPPLRNGDRLTAPEFEHRYEAMADLKKAELIGGVVYVGSPVSEDHGGPHFDLITWLGLYRIATPGIAGSDNVTIRLDLDNRPQPDALLRILPSHGGQASIGEDRYLLGAPELVAEIAVSSVSYDLHDKLDVYRRHGVREYVAWKVEDAVIDWYILREGRFDRMSPSAEGLYRSEVFPGLWLDAAALIRGDLPAVSRALQQGIATPEHADFVARLRRAAATK